MVVFSGYLGTLVVGLKSYLYLLVDLMLKIHVLFDIPFEVCAIDIPFEVCAITL